MPNSFCIWYVISDSWHVILAVNISPLSKKFWGWFFYSSSRSEILRFPVLILCFLFLVGAAHIGAGSTVFPCHLLLPFKEGFRRKKIFSFMRVYFLKHCVFVSLTHNTMLQWGHNKSFKGCFVVVFGAKLSSGRQLHL